VSPLPDRATGAGIPAVALELTGISKRFGAVQALDDVSFSARSGTVHALLGENGAGKTTLMRVANGLLRPDRGSIRLFGSQVVDHSVRSAIRAGIGMVHQHLSLVPTLTAVENLSLGRRGVFRPHDARRELTDLSESAGLRVNPDTVVRDLSIVEQQRLEILKALARGARVLILDEPTSGLAPAEIEELLRWVQAFASGGGAVVLVTHRVREALAVADDVTVLRRGRVVHVAAGLSDADENTRPTVDALARAIFSDAPEATASSHAPPTAGETILELVGVTVVDNRGQVLVRSATLSARRGEIVGVAAVEGSGHRELLRVMAGLLPPSDGRASLPRRIAIVPAERLRDALIPEFTLVENVALRGAGDRRGLTPWASLAQSTSALIDRYGIAAPSATTSARALSGGNQQRLVLARELSGELDLVVADDPTRGLDLRASAFVHDQLRHVASRGAAVVVHSSDLDELLSLATRILVVFHGTVREATSDRDVVGRAMLGGE
jgi:general nucleoside transport system ATP-binding protein